MLIIKRLTLSFVLINSLLVGVFAQQPSPVATVEVTASQKEAEVGQQVKLTVVAKDANGRVVNEAPSTYFAGPFDAAVADDNGMIKLVGPGEVIAGAVVGGKAGTTTIRVRPVGVKTIEVSSLKDPLIVGSVIQLEATTRTSSGDPRKGVPVVWTSGNAAVATVDAGGVVTARAPGKAAIQASSGEAKTATTVNVSRSTFVRSPWSPRQQGRAPGTSYGSRPGEIHLRRSRPDGP